MRFLLTAITTTSFVVASTIAAAPALAHTELVSSTPADGAALRSGPSGVSLTFSEPLDDAAVQIKVTKRGASVSQAERTTVRDGVASVSFTSRLQTGRYVVAYRVVSGDDHPVTGTVDFRVDRPAAVGSSAPGSDDTKASATAAPSVSTSAVGSSPSGAPAAAGSSNRPQDSSSTAVWFVAAGVVVVLSGVLVALALLRRRRGAAS